VMAAEYAAAGGPGARAVVSSACSRADEPAELLAYWYSRHGRRVPKAVKRGLADAASRLYTERNAIRWDASGHDWRMADVLELCHVRPDSPTQSALFRWLLDERHHQGTAVVDDRLLPVLRADLDWREVAPDRRRDLLAEGLPASVSWERLSSWLPGGMDAAAWEAVIPSMGYMALLRNLRNFDQAGISIGFAAQVAERLADPEEVARSRQFPMRFLSAYKATDNFRWAAALERALDMSLNNVPVLPGRTLVLIDVSGSMREGMSGRSTLQRWEAASVFGTALAIRNRADLFVYSTTARQVDYNPTAAVLRIVERIGKEVDGGTYTEAAIAAAYAGHDRVVVLTDEQSHDAGSRDLSGIPALYTFNLAGYRPASGPSGERGRHAFGGLSDAAFGMLSILDSGRDGDWPF
jgi:hypothetical protein